MWNVEFGVVEQVRASHHGRERMRREDRRPSDEATTISRLNGDDACGWALDRSDSGARVLLSSGADIAVGEVLTVTFGEDTVLARVVWARHENDACVLGLELVVVTGEVEAVDFAVLDLSDVA
jgi:hypothetical protein